MAVCSLQGTSKFSKACAHRLREIGWGALVPFLSTRAASLHAEAAWLMQNGVGEWCSATSRTTHRRHRHKHSHRRIQHGTTQAVWPRSGVSTRAARGLWVCRRTGSQLPSRPTTALPALPSSHAQQQQRFSGNPTAEVRDLRLAACCVECSIALAAFLGPQTTVTFPLSSTWVWCGPIGEWLWWAQPSSGSELLTPPLHGLRVSKAAHKRKSQRCKRNKQKSWRIKNRAHHRHLFPATAHGFPQRPGHGLIRWNQSAFWAVLEQIGLQKPPWLQPLTT